LTTIHGGQPPNIDEAAKDIRTNTRAIFGLVFGGKMRAYIAGPLFNQGERWFDE
jgi:hypothetical protein